MTWLTNGPCGPRCEISVANSQSTVWNHLHRIQFLWAELETRDIAALVSGGGTGGRETGRKGGGRCTGGGRRGGGKREKKGKITQHCAIFRNRKNAKGREPKNAGREPGLKGTGSGRFKPPCPPPLVSLYYSNFYPTNNSKLNWNVDIHIRMALLTVREPSFKFLGKTVYSHVFSPEPINQSQERLMPTCSSLAPGWGGRGEYSPKILVGLCGARLETLTLFQAKYVVFPTLFQT